MHSFDIFAILAFQAEKNYSDVHFASGCPPYFRNEVGEIFPDKKFPNIVTERHLIEAFINILGKEEMERLQENREINAIFDGGKHGRFRTNLAYSQKGLGAVLRRVKTGLPDVSSYDIPPEILDLTRKQSGLIIIAGKNNAGKTTFLNTLLNYINESQARHIVTFEDPIEYVHENKKSVITQRAIGSHSKSFSNAVENVLRQDADVLVIGEMRSEESMDTALRLAESGYLVFGTIHTNNATNSIQRMVDIYPPERQKEIFALLSLVLTGIICQKLIPGTKRNRVMAREYCIMNDAISSIIRNGELEHLENAMTTSQNIGNMLFLTCLQNLVEQGEITGRAALEEIKRL